MNSHKNQKKKIQFNSTPLPLLYDIKKTSNLFHGWDFIIKEG